MDDRGWEKIVDAIDAKFGILRHGRDSRPLEDKPELTEQVAFIEFERSGEHYKLERVASPAIADRKTYYHKAATGGVRFENVYDADSVSYRTNFYKQENGEWVALEPDAFSL